MNVAGDEDEVTTSDDDDISSPDRISSLGRKERGKRDRGKEKYRSEK
jgi:hypothetical protein